jgi:hypothetical protein
MYPRGAIYAPHKLAAAEPFRTIRDPAPAPACFITIPSQLSFWMNQFDGCCVSSEECFNIDLVATATTGQPYVVDDHALQHFLRQYGLANGAPLTDVMDIMAQSGLPDNGSTFFDGGYRSVDWTNYDEFCAALWQTKGSVKLAVAADQLQAVVQGGVSGWWLTSAQTDRNIDHCIGSCGYGPAEYLSDMLKSLIPSRLAPATPSIALFTWNSIGIAAHQAGLCPITGESYSRSPASIRKAANGATAV